MTGRAVGTFRVTMTPAPLADPGADPTLGRMTLAKTFEGDLAGSGRGEMLTAMTAVPGSAGYVAIERVEATLAGRTGSFVFQHSGTMDRTAPTLAISVVPDSATGDLAGLTGRFAIEIVGGEHRYVFEYSLPDEMR